MNWASQGQLAALGTQLRRRLPDRDARLDWCEARVGRPLDSSTELTAPEAARLLAEIGRARFPGRRGLNQCTGSVAR